MKKTLLLCTAISLGITLSSQAAVIDFSDLTLAPESYHNNPEFTSGGAGFNNDYNPTYQSWAGFSYSNTTDTTTPGYTNQYSAITGTDGSGVSGGIYGVAYIDSYTPVIPTITLDPANDAPQSIQVTNTAYAYYTMLDGDSFTDKFTAGDWFLLTISAYNSQNQLINAVEFYLADFRSSNSGDHYILDQWATVDLTSFGGGVASIDFLLTSSDTGVYGMNTPAYFAMDNLEVVPEPSTVLLLAIGAFLLAWKRGYRPQRA